jgi:hypothetical protein
MASITISARTVLVTGTAITDNAFATAAGDICTITGPTGGAIDLSSMVIRIKNEATSAGAMATIRAGTSTYSAIGLGSYTVTVPTALGLYIGGKGFESARFLNASAQSLIIEVNRTDGSAGTCTCTIDAVQGPFRYTA